MAEWIKHDHTATNPLSDGYKNYVGPMEPMGYWHRRKTAIEFAKWEKSWIELEREPGNKHDPNAIKVLGCRKYTFTTKRVHIGYLPRELAATVIALEFFNILKPLLIKTFYNYDTDFIEIKFVLTGPEEYQKDFKSVLRISTKYIKKGDD